MSTPTALPREGIFPVQLLSLAMLPRAAASHVEAASGAKRHGARALFRAIYAALTVRRPATAIQILEACSENEAAALSFGRLMRVRGTY